MRQCVLRAITHSDVKVKVAANVEEAERTIGRFITIDVLPVWTSFGKHFVARLVIRLQFKDGLKTRNTSRRASFHNSSFKTHFQKKLV